jgi:hypothetical protein
LKTCEFLKDAGCAEVSSAIKCSLVNMIRACFA